MYWLHAAVKFTVVNLHCIYLALGLVRRSIQALFSDTMVPAVALAVGLAWSTQAVESQVDLIWVPIYEKILCVY